MADLREIVYWLKTPGRWGRGEYLYIEGDRALVDVFVEGGHVLEWIEVSRLVKREAATSRGGAKLPHGQ